MKTSKTSTTVASRAVRQGMIVCAVVIVSGMSVQAFSGDRQPTSQPDQFVLGRHTFIDVGPPNDYYELFLVRQTAAGVFIQRITLTPAADSCTMPATVEIASASLKQSVAELLGPNLCKIPEKELNRERKRCKNCLVFSGANVAVQVQCGVQTRIIRSDILDKDMFDPAPHTPKNTSWTMQLLERLDEAIGQPGVLDKPMFQLPEDNRQVAASQEPDVLQELAAGKYNALFKDAPHKLSVLYKATKLLPPSPSVRLLSSTPFQPEMFIAPVYSPLARLARVEGEVTLKVDVDTSGRATNLTIVSGSPLLRGMAENAVNKWKFPRKAANQQVEAVMEFKTNCPAR